MTKPAEREGDPALLLADYLFTSGVDDTVAEHLELTTGKRGHLQSGRGILATVCGRTPIPG